MNQPEISIITVVKDDCAGMKVTAESIVHQSAFSRIEWVVIDAASRDGTVDVIQSHSDKIAFWVSEPDSGIYDAMNKGLEKVKGKYCLFLNAGDALHANDVIERVLANENYGRVDYLSGSTQLCRHGKKEAIDYAPEKVTGRLLFERSLSHQATFIRTSRLKSMGGYDRAYKITADAKAFFHDIIILNASYEPLHFVVADYDITGISSTNYQLTTEERNRFLSTLLPSRMYDDYRKMVYGETALEKIQIKIQGSVKYKLLTIIALVIYSPTALFNRIRMKLRK